MSFLVENQIELSLALLGAILAGYQLGVPLTDRFIELQGKLVAKDGQAYYRNTLDDAYFVTFWVIAFTLIRAATMKYLLGPLADQFQSLKELSKRVRFCEQLWLVIYYAISFTVGMWIMSTMPHWMNTRELWVGYPHVELTYRFKAYYLMSMGFWLQQLYVLQIEEKRKDFYQMLSHHLITCTLVVASYATHYTRVGNAVLCTMDFADIFLSGAKVLRYMRFMTLCNVMFGFFVLSWVVTRHIIYGILMYSIHSESLLINDSPIMYPDESYFSPEVINSFLVLLGLLQLILIYWFVLILRIIIRVVKGEEAEDDRSADEGDDDDTAAKSSDKKHD
ncbi:Sphingosine N-acyltransferase lag1 [Dimargaris verticillata]|uniref:Sphingosine N-acyltransferase lag1 n=1 Tax=Dimargaris verticillata TaxID=2761393 RepID=A0A9W8B1H2_9FUNG|nr:Sphingosine N-acyltransferase lag1 [Dimargaris verticillata]